MTLSTSKIPCKGSFRLSSSLPRCQSWLLLLLERVLVFQLSSPKRDLDMLRISWTWCSQIPWIRTSNFQESSSKWPRNCSFSMLIVTRGLLPRQWESLDPLLLTHSPVSQLVLALFGAPNMVVPPKNALLCSDLSGKLRTWQHSLKVANRRRQNCGDSVIGYSKHMILVLKCAKTCWLNSILRSASKIVSCSR